MLARVRAVLTPPAEGTPPVQEELVAALVELGDEAVPVLFALLAGQVGLNEDELAPDGAQSYSRQDRILLQALPELPPRPLAEELRRQTAVATGDEGLKTRLVVLRVMEHATLPDALPLWFEIAEGIAPIHRLRTYVQRPLVGALARVLADDRDAYRELIHRSSEFDEGLTTIAACAVGEAGDPTGFEVLERLLGSSPSADVVVLEQAGAIAAGLLGPPPERGLRWVRASLSASDGKVRGQAVTTLVELGDTGSIRDLIALLEDPNRRVQSCSRVGLERLTGMRLGAHPRRWNEWYDGQRRWLDTQAVTLQRQLESQDPADVVAALGALGQRRLFREELVEVVAPTLWRPETQIVAATCSALGQLGSKRATPYLLDALRDPEESVRTSAWRALKTLTHVDLPPSYDAWAERVEG